jgi:hypothetical protein
VARARALPHLGRDILKPRPEVLGHRFHDGESFFEHIADEIRNGDAEIVRDSADVLSELLGDAGVQNPLFASTFARSIRLPTLSRGAGFARFGLFRVFRVFHARVCITS